MKKVAILIFTLTTIYSFAQNYCTYQWTKQIGGANDESLTSMDSDTSGNIYCTFFTKSPQLYYQNYLLPENQDAYIAKISPEGELGWVLSAFSTNFIHLNRIKVTHNNSDLFVIGTFKGTTTIGDTTLLDSTGQDASTNILIKLTQEGELLWVKKFRLSSSFGIMGMDLDSYDNLYFTGTSKDSIIIIGNDTLSSYSVYDMPILKYDSDGNFLWGSHAGTDGFGLARARAITIDNENNIILAGDCYGSSFIYQEDTILNPMGYYLLFMKLDNNGDLLWAKFPACESMNSSSDIACDSEGEVYITGQIQGDVSFDTIEFSFTYRQAFFAGLTHNGEYKWVRTTETGGSPWGSAAHGWSICCNKDDDVVASGYFQRSVKFGSIILTTGFVLEYNAFLAKIHKDGNFEWAMQIYNFAYDDDYYGRATIIDQDNNIYTSGVFVDQGSFGDTSLIALGQNDIYLAKLYEIETQIRNMPAELDIMVYNSGNTIYIKELRPSSNYKLTIYNITGEIVHQHQISSRNSFEFKHDLPHGVYLVEINDGQKNTIKKVFLN